MFTKGVHQIRANRGGRTLFLPYTRAKPILNTAVKNITVVPEQFTCQILAYSTRRSTPLWPTDRRFAIFPTTTVNFSSGQPAVISFLLDGTEHRLEQLDPNTTVLDYLRENLGLTGTKEGCASGDCGACTVVVTYPQGDALSYLAINACITLLATLDGCQLLTVESLARDGQLHRVQQAMVDCHASQCGFCTPGFVMSMFAYRKSNRHFNAHAIETALGGNLCRCTGYRPIVDAAVQMYEPDASDSFSKGTLATLRALEGLRAEPSTPSCAADGRNFLAPSSAGGGGAARAHRPWPMRSPQTPEPGLLPAAPTWHWRLPNS